MKKLMLICLILWSFLLVYGQTGLFNISFNQNYKDAVKSLQKQGFTISDTTDASITFVNPKLPKLTKLQLRDSYSKNQVSGWTISFQVNGDTALIDKYKSELTDLHKVSPWYDDYYCEYVWELDYPNGVYLYTTDDDDTLVIKYTEIDYDDYWY